MAELLPFLLFLFVIIVLLSGFPVAFSLGGASLIFAFIAYLFGAFDPAFMSALPARLYGIMKNETLIAVPLFIFMGTLLERSKISEDLLEEMGRAFRNVRGGLTVSVCIVGAILAASTGIVGATVVTMGLISLPVMLRHKYNPAFSCGVITASGTLGQIIPPSIVLILLGDVISNANQKAQLEMGNFSPDSVSVGDLFFGAFIPGLLLVVLYLVYIALAVTFKPHWGPAITEEKRGETKSLFFVLLSPIILIVSVLGSIVSGIATPTEAAAVGAFGAAILAAIKKSLTAEVIKDTMFRSTRVSCMVFTIFIGANIFSLVFRGLGGDEVVVHALQSLPGGVVTAFVLVMLIMFLLGFFLDFIEIIFVVVPIIAPILIQLGLDPIWLGVMIAINLQTSFLTPPFGFALFYLKGVAPPTVQSKDIYLGAIPFILIQLSLLVVLWYYPDIVTWLPQKIYN